MVQLVVMWRAVMLQPSTIPLMWHMSVMAKRQQLHANSNSSHASHTPYSSHLAGHRLGPRQVPHPLQVQGHPREVQARLQQAAPLGGARERPA